MTSPSASARKERALRKLSLPARHARFHFPGSHALVKGFKLFIKGQRGLSLAQIMHYILWPVHDVKNIIEMGIDN